MNFDDQEAVKNCAFEFLETKQQNIRAQITGYDESHDVYNENDSMNDPEEFYGQTFNNRITSAQKNLKVIRTSKPTG